MITYEQALAFLHNSMKFGIKPGLERIVKLLDMMGNPQQGGKFIHIAGTNGKGSTSAMIASVLRKAGYRTGLFISPYIEDFCERISINGEMIHEDALCQSVEKIREIISIMQNEGYEHPTEFEMITAIALDYFSAQQCDYVVLEVGLGGRLDSTNVIECPIVSVITSISYDHMNILGDTLSQIAEEKAGIIKDNSNVVLYPIQQRDAQQVIFRTTQQKNCQLIIPDLNQLYIKTQSLEGAKFLYRDLEIDLPLIGQHQIYNCITALEALECVKKGGAALTDEAIKQGISQIVFPGRMEIVSNQPLVILDGAHNTSGIEALCKVMDEYLRNKQCIVIMGMLQDKQYEFGISEVAKRADMFFAVNVDNPRTLPAAETARIAGHFTNAEALKREAAIKKALELAKDGGVVFVCGSLYLLGQFRQYFKG